MKKIFYMFLCMSTMSFATLNNSNFPDHIISPDLYVFLLKDIGERKKSCIKKLEAIKEIIKINEEIISCEKELIEVDNQINETKQRQKHNSKDNQVMNKLVILLDKKIGLLEKKTNLFNIKEGLALLADYKVNSASELSSE